MTHAVSSKWNTLTEEEKRPFVKMAEEAMKEYQKEKSEYNEKILEESMLLQETRKRKAAAEAANQEKSPQQMRNAQPQTASALSTATSRTNTSRVSPLDMSLVGFSPGIPQQMESPGNFAQLLSSVSATYPQQNDLFTRVSFNNQHHAAILPILPTPELNLSTLSSSILQNSAISSQTELLLRLNALEEEAYRRRLLEMQYLQARQERELANRLHEGNILGQLIASRASDAEFLNRINGISALEQLLASTESVPDSSLNPDTSTNRRPM